MIRRRRSGIIIAGFEVTVNRGKLSTVRQRPLDQTLHPRIVRPLPIDLAAVRADAKIVIMFPSLRH